MRIALDYTAAYEQGGGIGRYVRELTAALGRLAPEDEYLLFVAGFGARPLPPLPGENFAWKLTRVSPRWWARLWHRLQLPIPVEWFTGSVDIFHATDFTLPPTKKTTRTLLTVHDLSFVRVPDLASPSLRTYLNVVVPRSVARADHVLADSQATKDDLVELYGTSPDKITVLLSGVDSRFRRVTDAGIIGAVRNKYNLPRQPFIFSIGTVQPRKNYARLIAALAQLRRKGHDLALVIAGGKGWLDDEIYASLETHRVADSVRFIGYAADDDLPALYSAAHIVAMPSLYEGFGLPVLEGMACGTPVLTSNVSSLPEVAGSAAIMVDPYSTDAIAAGLEQLAEDQALRDQLIRLGAEHVRAFSWDAAAAKLRQIYASLA